MQINANRSRFVMDEALTAAIRHQCHIMVLSEPNIRALERIEHYLDDASGAAIADLTGILGAPTISKGNGFVVASTSKIAVVSVYLSPNIDIDIYIAAVDDIAAEIRRLHAGLVLVCGDFNAKCQVWGGTITDNRGRILQDAMSALDYTCVNRADSPTYAVPGRAESVIDLCFLSEMALNRFTDWKICDEVVLSDHKAVLITLGGAQWSNTDRNRRPGISPKELEVFRSKYTTEAGSGRMDSPGEYMRT